MERAEYLLARTRGGKFLYENFKAMENAGITPYVKTKPIRKELQDYNHIAFFALHFYSHLYFSPSCAYDFYKLGKIIGYCTAESALKTLKLKSIITSLSKRGLVWKIFQNKLIQDAQHKGWLEGAGGILELIEIDKENKKLRYSFKENDCFIIKNLVDKYSQNKKFKIEKPCNYFSLGILSGQTEALFGSFWDGIEKKCITQGDECCEFELYLHEEEEPSRISPLEKEEYEAILKWSILLAISKEKDTGRKVVKNLIPLCDIQSLNYLLISKSKGHRILTKWSGRTVGKGLIKEVNANNIFEVLDYLKDFFLDLKVGIMNYEFKVNRIEVKLEESVYSSGVKPIGMKLCIFLAGILWGSLIQVTKVDWLVKDEKCIANGDPWCEFVCRTKNLEALKKMLLE
jgi:predicted hydrocarbon binding protein